MDGRVLFLSTLFFVFGEGLSSGAGPEGEVRIFLFLNASSQGQIVGEAPLPNDPKQFAIEVVEVRDRVMVPTDQASGLPLGIRRYDGVVIRKPVDKTTPQIATVLANNEDLIEAQLHVYMSDGMTGQLQHRFTYTMQNALVREIKRDFRGVPVGSTTSVLRPEEEITIRFQTIRITDVLNSTEFEDTVGGVADVPVESMDAGDEVTLARDEETVTAVP